MPRSAGRIGVTLFALIAFFATPKALATPFLAPNDLSLIMEIAERRRKGEAPVALVPVDEPSEEVREAERPRSVSTGGVVAASRGAVLFGPSLSVAFAMSKFVTLRPIGTVLVDHRTTWGAAAFDLCVGTGGSLRLDVCGRAEIGVARDATIADPFAVFGLGAALGASQRVSERVAIEGRVVPEGAFRSGEPGTLFVRAEMGVVVHD